MSKVYWADIAYNTLKQIGHPLHYKELLDKVIAASNIQTGADKLLAAIHTEINLDPRFKYLGNAEWGLKEWSDSFGTNSSKDYEDEDEEFDKGE